MRLAILLLPALLLTACVTEGTTASQESADCSLIDSPAEEQACRIYEKTKAKDSETATNTTTETDLASDH
ncbi:hypothetical protein [Hyphomonas oceanitis]|uniref:hypothetical protein n=1 Tax=Hyphomonas oceanitis TaxID=81033 RepID=UPI0030024384